MKLYTSCRPDLRSDNPDLRPLERQDNRFTTKSCVFLIYALRFYELICLFFSFFKSENVDIFKRNLKTYLFKKSFSYFISCMLSFYCASFNYF